MSPGATLRAAVITTLGCTTSFDLASLPLRDVPPPDLPALDLPALDLPAPPDDVVATDVPAVRDVTDATTLDAPALSPDIPGAADAPPMRDTLRCGGAGEPCCTRDARADVCDSGFACDATQRCARCALSEALCDGRCVVLASDSRHCGACDAACPHTTTCRGGVCAPTACAPGFDNCDAASGCATDLGRNASHCGRCGVSCARPNAVTACEAGVCVLRACQGAFANCDDDPANGCEAATHNDPENCGACGRACPAAGVLDRVRRSCANGVCQRRCQDGWYDCNGDASDCEIGVTQPICMPCDDPRCRTTTLPPDGRERRCCTFMRGTITCCSQ